VPSGPGTIASAAELSLSYPLNADPVHHSSARSRMGSPHVRRGPHDSQPATLWGVATFGARSALHPLATITGSEQGSRACVPACSAPRSARTRCSYPHRIVCGARALMSPTTAPAVTMV